MVALLLGYDRVRDGSAERKADNSEAGDKKLEDHDRWCWCRCVEVRLSVGVMKW